MKNSKMLLSLAAAGISLVCGAYQDGDIDNNTENVPVAEQILFGEIVADDEPSDTRFKNLFEHCYQMGDIGACQSLHGQAEAERNSARAELLLEKVENVALIETLMNQNEIILNQAKAICALSEKVGKPRHKAKKKQHQ